MIPLGTLAPDFTCRSTRGELSLSEYRGRWLVFYSHAADFTPVCTSEFVAVAEAQPAVRAEGCDVLGLSVDSLFSHIVCLHSIRKRFGAQIDLPVVEDPSRASAQRCGMLGEAAESSATLRALFVIDPDGVVRAASCYPMTTGRSVAGILRTVRALRLTDAHGVATPEGWLPGDDVIEPPALEDLDTEAGAPGAWIYRTRPLEEA